MELIRRFPPQIFASALESWGFIDTSAMEHVFVSPFGDVFLRSATALSRIDILTADFEAVAESLDELQTVLNTGPGQEQLLRSSLAAEAEQAGLVPTATQILDFIKPPVLGGQISVDNLAVADFAVAVNIAGQIHTQIRNLPPGTRIAGVSMQ